MKNIERFAQWVSALWLAVTILVIYWNRDGSFNEVGDFMAGMMSALAFFWLVIGYYLQRKELSLQREELKLNREALLLQAEELKRLVQENKELVRHSSRLADLQEKEIDLSQQEEEPLLIPLSIPKKRGRDPQITKITFENRGGDAINLTPQLEGVRNIRITPLAGGISRGGQGIVVIEHDGRFTNPVTVFLTYENKFGVKKRITFELSEETQVEDLVDNFRKPVPI